MTRGHATRALHEVGNGDHDGRVLVHGPTDALSDHLVVLLRPPEDHRCMHNFATSRKRGWTKAIVSFPGAFPRSLCSPSLTVSTVAPVVLA